MCGIAGALELSTITREELQVRVCRMAEQLVHRGPDDSGVWVDDSAGVALGFRRLAILDLSPTGHQPMLSATGRYVMVFNGEVYNFQELRQELEPQGHKFRGRSDTEVMLAAITEWGIEAAVRKFVGMFAFAVWDREERALHLVRDRIGIKPLYYGWMSRAFLFGSELKALRAHPAFVPQINRSALALQLRYDYIPQPYSIYKGIRKLPPGCILSIRFPGIDSSNNRTSSVYWSAREVAERGAAEPFAGTEDEARQQLDALLRAAVRLRMIADVPLGAFLSGGIDSSTVVALMQTQSSRPVKTFTIGYHEGQHNEAPQAKAVAQHLGTEHTDLYVTPKEALAVIPRLPMLYDEPFSDGSQIPTHLLSALTRQHVTVSLSGDGGDELFAGYDHYPVGAWAWQWRRRLPRFWRVRVARMITALSAPTYDRLLGSFKGPFGRYGRSGSIGLKGHKLAGMISARDALEFYRTLVSRWPESAKIVLGAGELPTLLDDASQAATLSSIEAFMMFMDQVTYLPDDILTKVDRASMGVSLEARVPILDHRVVEFAARLPVAWKIRNGTRKWLLREVLHRYVPRELVDRPKTGFDVPLDIWLRGPLREWAESLLSEDRLRREGYLRPEPIRALWQQHLTGLHNWRSQLWNVLMFQAWLEAWEGA